MARPKANFIAALWQGGTSTKRHLVLRHDFVTEGENYIIKEIENGFKISRPTLQYRGSTHSAYRTNNNWLRFTVVTNMPLGQYEIDNDLTDLDNLYIFKSESEE